VVRKSLMALKCDLLHILLLNDVKPPDSAGWGLLPIASY
jgi:hypothetical protein